MKNLYVNSRLHPLLIALRGKKTAKKWIFSQGEAWLLLTPERFAHLASRLGLGDGRVFRLMGLIRRHSAVPERYCRLVGLPGTRQLKPEEYPLALCPRCDGAHYPHPEDAGRICPECAEKAFQAERRRPGGGELRDRREDDLARRRVRRKEPRSFNGNDLSPNFRINLNRRVHRDWDLAAHRILTGGRYKDVARDFDCSTGLLHRQVRKRTHWENN